MEVLDRTEINPAMAWVAALVTGILGIAAAAIAFPVRVYRGFIWQYFWGPVHADADGVSCYVHFPDEGQTRAGSEALGCSADAYEATAFVAEPGYTVVSTIGYILILVFMLAGVYLLLDRYDLRPYHQTFFALIPFMLFGGALRTVEDAFVAALQSGATPALEFPASAVMISPLIYFTVFTIALGALLASKSVQHRGLAQSYTYPFAGIGIAILALTFAYLLYLSITTDYVAFHPTILLAILGLASLAAIVAHFGADRVKPGITAGTGLIGLAVLWGHAIDGFANVIANDWTHVWNLGLDYAPKHPFNEFVMETTTSLQGGDAIAGIYVGEAWPFALIKILVALAIVSLFDDEFMEESPRFAILLLGAIVAVGLGPGTRDMLRVTFGI